MKVLVTGATGFIGSAVVKELLLSGHQVIGLARSLASASLLRNAGVEVLQGSLENLDVLKAGAKASDGIIHTGFIHDFSKFKESCELDRLVIGAFGDALAGTNKPLVVTSGIGLLPQGRISFEYENPSQGSVNPRKATEEAVQFLVERGLNVSLVRLPPSVHGEGDHGFVPILINFAREKGVSAYIGEGTNLWPAVHRFDAAHLFKLALEKGFSGARFHGVAEEGVPFKKIAEIIGKHLDLPVVSLNPEEAASHFSWFAHFAGINAPSSSKRTQEELGWKFSQIDLLSDIDQAYYYDHKHL